MAKNLIPVDDGQQDLGREDRRWRSGYIDALISGNVERNVAKLIDADDLALALQEISAATPENCVTPQELEAAVMTKADANHSHAELETAIAAKASAEHSHVELETAITGKADREHAHMELETAITGLRDSLAEKLDADDPLLQDFASASHAASHISGGSDPLTAEDIGALPAPPTNGKSYLATGGGWVEYIAPATEGEEREGTSDHAQLVNRDAPGQHPQEAVIDLVSDLDTLRSGVAAVQADIGACETRADELAAGLAAKADAAALVNYAKPADITTALGAYATTSSLASGLAGKANAAHTHTTSQVDGLAAALAAKADAAALGSYAKPADITSALAAYATTNSLTSGLAGKANASHTHTTGQVDGLTTALAAKADATALAAYATASSLTSGLAGKANATHTHSDLQTAIAAKTGEAPSNGKSYLRKNSAWVEYEAPSGGSGALTGEIRFLPFRSGALPSGWYFCNGDRFALTSAVGAALNALTANFKTDWGIAASGGTINLPNLFSGQDGYFLRAANNSTRLPGSVQTDAIRNITGTFVLGDHIGLTLLAFSRGVSSFEGAFCSGAGRIANGTAHTATGNAEGAGDLKFDASRVVPTAHENRPINIAMTPAIYLGA